MYFRATWKWHMEVPRRGVQSELQLPAYTTDAATRDPSQVWDLHCSSWQHRILNPLKEARDQTCVLMDTGQVSHDGNSLYYLYRKYLFSLAILVSRAIPAKTQERVLLVNQKWSRIPVRQTIKGFQSMVKLEWRILTLNSPEGKAALPKEAKGKYMMRVNKYEERSSYCGSAVNKPD